MKKVILIAAAASVLNFTAAAQDVSNVRVRQNAAGTTGQSAGAEGMLLAKGAHVYPFNESNIFVNAKGMNIYEYYKPDRLGESDMRELMADNRNALWLYNRGKSQNWWGNICLISGASLVAITFVGNRFQMQPILYNRDAYHWSNFSFTSICVGSAALLTGSILKPFGTRNVRKSVNLYNNNSLKPVSGMEWKFDFTGNGVRLGMRF